MNRATRLNPSGIRSYDHTPYASHPAYAAAVQAVADLQRAITALNPRMPVNDFHHLLADLSAGWRISDKCPACSDGPHLPYRVEHDDCGTVGRYRSGCGHEWSCSWSVTSPYALGDAA